MFLFECHWLRRATPTNNSEYAQTGGVAWWLEGSQPMVGQSAFRVSTGMWCWLFWLLSANWFLLLFLRDTAGQERFNSITSAYYRSAKGIILVYDITKKETFDDLPKWMKMIDKYASEDAELLLVGNKLDCETDREITRQQGEKFAQQITGMRFCEASAKDNFNVDEIFLKLVDDILKKMPLDILRNELSNSILSLQPEPEIPPELPPPRPHVRCCWLLLWRQSGSDAWKGENVLFCTTIILTISFRTL